MLAISPHLDDAVFACGELLAAHPGATVVTVFAGSAAPGSALTQWDAACGFRTASEAVRRRRAEDRAALAVLGAHPVWLEFRDRQYGPSPPLDSIAAALRQVIVRVRPECVVLPLGLFHSDHRLAHDAALACLRQLRIQRWLAYEDALYRRIEGLLQRRLGELRAAGVGLTPAPVPARRRAGRKRAAVRRYASQLRALAAPGRLGHADAFAPEGYWEIACPRSLSSS